MNQATFMFSNPTLATVNTLMLFGILLGVFLVRYLKRENTELHKKSLALRKKLGDDGE